MEYTLRAMRHDERGRDAMSTLTMRVVRALPPSSVTDFAGGAGQLFDGYRSNGVDFDVVAVNDGRALELVNRNGRRVSIEVPVGPAAIRQLLSVETDRYMITYLSW
jgi:hypothetical protein